MELETVGLTLKLKWVLWATSTLTLLLLVRDQEKKFNTVYNKLKEILTIKITLLLLTFTIHLLMTHLPMEMLTNTTSFTTNTLDKKTLILETILLIFWTGHTSEMVTVSIPLHYLAFQTATIQFTTTSAMISPSLINPMLKFYCPKTCKFCYTVDNWIS